MKTKFRTYAAFQFMTFIAMVSLMVSALLTMYDGNASGKEIDSKVFWGESLSNGFTFHSTTTLAFASSIFLYITISLWLISWIIGGMIMAAKQKNLFDNLFTYFFFIPLVANIFALIAQFSLNSTEYSDAKINKKEIIKMAESELRQELKDEALQIKELRKELGPTGEIKKPVAKRKVTTKKVTVKKTTVKKPAAKKKAPAKKKTTTKKK